jgi:selenocysteine lyase/cysteine desulfurase
MECQKHLFQLPEEIHYLNCAYMAPLLKSVEEKGIEGLRRKRNPASITPADFFTGVDEVRRTFATIIQGNPSQVAVMPSVSYGMNSLIGNIPFRPGQYGLTLSEEFPSCYYAARRWCNMHGTVLKVVAENQDLPQKGEDWNQRILEAIQPETAFLVMASVHWMNGIRFNLEEIGKRCREVGTKLIVDGSQSVGALPVNVSDSPMDALICAGYKWLMGPYSTALAYVHEGFNEGIPLEESWMSRPNAERFERLTNYQEGYKPGAVRYDVGQTSNFITIPMLNEALNQLLKWGVPEIQNYCGELSGPLIRYFHEKGIPVEEREYRANHLLGLRLPESVDGEKLLGALQQRKVYVSLRGSNLRISVNVFNTAEDIEQLKGALNL